ncbi:MAG: DUF2058 family protein [Pseudomonadota bacterium]|nr:DUF2058 family protein [Pseudomonadota bacterium]
MSKSLQDQLLALGVADKKKAKQAKHQQRVGPKEAKGPGVQESLQEAQQKARNEKKVRDQTLATERKAKRLRAEKLAQVRDMVKSNLIDRGNDAQRVDFRFPYGKKIRPFPVSSDVRDRLARGMIGLIELDGAICIVPRDVLEKCIERLEGREIFSHLAKLEVQDDDYPRIPDDLDW